MGSCFVPCKRCAAEALLGADFVGLHGVLFDGLEEFLLGQVEHLDSSFGTNDEPIELLGEDNAVDGGLAVRIGEPLALDEVPYHDVSVAGSGSEVGRVVDHVEGVDLRLVASEGVHEVHVQVIPHLDGLVPRGGHADLGLRLTVVLNARHGIGVLVLVYGMLQLTASVPDLDLVVKSSGDNLPVVVGKSNRENVFGVSNKFADGSS